MHTHSQGSEVVFFGSTNLLFLLAERPRVTITSSGFWGIPQTAVWASAFSASRAYKVIRCSCICEITTRLARASLPRNPPLIISLCWMSAVACILDWQLRLLSPFQNHTKNDYTITSVTCIHTSCVCVCGCHWFLVCTRGLDRCVKNALNRETGIYKSPPVWQSSTPSCEGGSRCSQSNAGHTGNIGGETRKDFIFAYSATPGEDIFTNLIVAGSTIEESVGRDQVWSGVFAQCVT